MGNTLRFVFATAFAVVVNACVPIPCPAQEQAVYAFFGTEEELSEEDLLRIESLVSRPVAINSAGRVALVDSGLFSAYQAASILDYRERLGDILSVAEFALVDGIGEYMAKVLAPFLSFAPSGASQSSRLEGSALGKFLWKDGSPAWAARFTLKSGNADASIAARSVYADKKLLPPSSWAVYGAWTKAGWKLVAGDFNLRFGQGLALWSGMSLSGITSPLSLYKRGSPLSGTSSYSGASHRGLAASLSVGRLVITPFLSFPGLRERCQGGKTEIKVFPGGNVTLLLPKGQLGLTGTSSALSVDGRFCLAGKDVFAEACWEPESRAIAALGGAVFPVGERGRIGFQARCYPRLFKGKYAGAVRTWSKTADESGLTLSYGAGDLAIAADAASRLSKNQKQIKLSITDVFKLSSSLALKLRAVGKHRNYGNEKVRTDLRADLCYSATGLKINGRLDWVHSAKNGLLAYLEAALEKADKGVLWLRATVFDAVKWADRVYSYERDAPGSFLIPAYYGRGFALSAYLNTKIRFGGRQSLACYLRASYTGYWQKKKPSVPEVRLAMAYNF